MDREVGRLLDAYRRMGFADNSFTIFTADHGESLMEHERWFTHGHHVYEEVLHVPLLVQGPGVSAARVSDAVSLADVAPTLLRFTGLDPMPGLYGRSLSDTVPDRAIFGEATKRGLQWRSMWVGREKWMVRVGRGGSAGQEPRIVEYRYYDLDTDECELHSQAWPSDDRASRLLQLIETDPDPAGVPIQLSRGLQLSAPKVAPGLDEDTLRRLRSLGYVR